MGRSRGTSLRRYTPRKTRVSTPRRTNPLDCCDEMPRSARSARDTGDEGRSHMYDDLPGSRRTGTRAVGACGQPSWADPVRLRTTHTSGPENSHFGPGELPPRARRTPTSAREKSHLGCD